MIGRASLTLAAALACPAAADTAPAYQAPYEVVMGDPSCNGNHERMVRVELQVPAFSAVHIRDLECSVVQRSGVDLQRIPIDCPEAEPPVSGASGSAQDSLGLNAEIQICQSIWQSEFSLSSGELVGTYGGQDVSLPLFAKHAVRDLSTISYLAGPEPHEPLLVEVAVSCTEPALLGREPGPPILWAEARFLLAERDLATCTSESCFGQVDVERARPDLKVYLQCAEVTP